MKSLLRSIKRLFCCRNNHPHWLSHLLYECSAKRRTSEWCGIFLDNYRFLTTYDEQAIARVHERYAARHTTETLIEAIREDVKRPNVIHTAIGLFASFIRMKYAETINPTQITINRIKKDFEEFTQLLRDCLVLYYNLDRVEHLFESESFSRGTLTNLCIQLIFDSDDFYETVGQLQRRVDRESNDKVQFNMQKFEVLRPQEYGILPEYCLDESTLAKHGVEGQVTGRPYDSSIEFVREIVRERYPEDKLKKVQTVISSIEQAIAEFYQRYRLKDYEPLNADSLISLLVYIIIQSKQGSLTSHLKLITNYINRDDLNSGLGYSLASIEACLQFIEKGNIKRSNGVKVTENELSLWLSLQNYFEQITSIDL